MGITSEDIRRMTFPLCFIFWGGLICIFDLRISETINGEGCIFDIVSDVSGMLMITWGVSQLAGMQVDDWYRSVMRFAQVTAVLSVIQAIHEHFIYDTPAILSWLVSILGLMGMVAIMLFCLAMHRLSTKAGLATSAKSWHTTTWLFGLIYLVPLGLFYGAGAIMIAMGQSFHIDLGPVGLLLLPIFCLPLIHLFVSTSRMDHEASLVQGEIYQPIEAAKSSILDIKVSPLLVVLLIVIGIVGVVLAWAGVTFAEQAIEAVPGLFRMPMPPSDLYDDFSSGTAPNGFDPARWQISDADPEGCNMYRDSEKEWAVLTADRIDAPLVCPMRLHDLRPYDAIGYIQADFVVGDHQSGPFYLPIAYIVLTTSNESDFTWSIECGIFTDGDTLAGHIGIDTVEQTVERHATSYSSGTNNLGPIRPGAVYTVRLEADPTSSILFHCSVNGRDQPFSDTVTIRHRDDILRGLFKRRIAVNFGPGHPATYYVDDVYVHDASFENSDE
ncbi:MAG: hypothetical protein JXB07_15210 [Anaerolineae bacterium]|nr:hypothetical protein [Anaerolineae bacterium]